MQIDLKKMTKTERVNYNHAIDALRMIEHDLHSVLLEARMIPAEWHEVAQSRDRRDGKRTRCTVAFDADVVRFFKAMGPGYQHRMNRVLRAWMHMRLAKLLKGPDVNDYVLRPEAVEAGLGERPKFGDAEAFYGFEDIEMDGDRRTTEELKMGMSEFSGE